MLRTIHLHGNLADKFGTHPIKLDVDTPQMVINGLSSGLPGFDHMLRQNTNLAFVRKDASGNCAPVTIDDFTLTLGNTTDIHLLAVPEGAGAEAAAFIGSYFGGSLFMGYAVLIIVEIIAITAISQALATSADASKGPAGGERPSFIFNGPMNITSPGYPVQLLYGECRVGSVVLGMGVETVQLLPPVPEPVPPETPDETPYTYPTGPATDGGDGGDSGDGGDGVGDTGGTNGSAGTGDGGSGADGDSGTA